MLEGLEITELKLSEVRGNNDSLRFDSEFFQKEYFYLLDILSSKSQVKLGGITSWITQGPNPIFCESDEFSIPCLTGRNINKGRVNYLNSDFVDASEYKSLSRFQVRVGDTLVTLKGKGSIGKIGYVTDERKAIFSRDIGIIRPSGVNHAYVNAFILSKFGQKLIARGETGGTGQSTLTTSYLKSIFVPRLSIEKSIGDLVLCSEDIFKKYQLVYEKAENLLLDTLGMADFSPSAEGINVKSFNDSFAATGRLDAEYYQPKYEQVIAHITAQAHDKLAALVTIKKSIEPGSDEYADDEQGLPFMRVADYSKYGISPPQKKIKTSFVADNQIKLDELMPKAGTILFSKDGSVGEAYCLRVDADFITSGAVLHLAVRNPDKLLPDYLTLALNSRLVKMQAERDAGGSIILHWRVGEIENVIVPLVDMPTQKKIAALVQESFALKAESEHLLDVAKRAVEIAIEQDEAAGMAYIEANS